MPILLCDFMRIFTFLFHFFTNLSRSIPHSLTTAADMILPGFGMMGQCDRDLETWRSGDVRHHRARFVSPDFLYVPPWLSPVLEPDSAPPRALDTFRSLLADEFSKSTEPTAEIVEHLPFALLPLLILPPAELNSCVWTVTYLYPIRYTPGEICAVSTSDWEYSEIIFTVYLW